MEVVFLFFSHTKERFEKLCSLKRCNGRDLTVFQRPTKVPFLAVESNRLRATRRTSSPSTTSCSVGSAWTLRNLHGWTWIHHYHMPDRTRSRRKKDPKDEEEDNSDMLLSLSTFSSETFEKRRKMISHDAASAFPSCPDGLLH